MPDPKRTTLTRRQIADFIVSDKKNETVIRALENVLGAPIARVITPAGVTGAQEINAAQGSVNFAAAATSLIVTNNFVTVDSDVIVTVATSDATMKGASAVVANGSFVIFPNAAPTAETRVNFNVVD